MCLGIPAKVVEVERFGDLGLVQGKVDFSGVLKEVNLSFTPEVNEGDYVVVHVGFAITKLDEASAHETLDLLRQIGAYEEELGEAPP